MTLKQELKHFALTHVRVSHMSLSHTYDGVVCDSILKTVLSTYSFEKRRYVYSVAGMFKFYMNSIELFFIFSLHLLGFVFDDQIKLNKKRM